MILVWSDKTVLEMVFVKSTSFIWPMYMALRSKNVYNYTAFKRMPAGTLDHLTYVGMSIRDLKNNRKSIVKYLSEDRQESEGAMISFQNGTKVRKNVCCICIWVTQICSLSSL